MSKRQSQMQKRIGVAEIVELTGDVRGVEAALIALGMNKDTKVYQAGRTRVYAQPPADGRGWHVAFVNRTAEPSFTEVLRIWRHVVPDYENRVGGVVLQPFAVKGSFCIHALEIKPETAKATPPAPAKVKGIMTLDDLRKEKGF